MKDGLRFVDCDMHIMEPSDLFETYLDPKFKDRVILPTGEMGAPVVARWSLTAFPHPWTRAAKIPQTESCQALASDATQPLSGSRIAEAGRHGLCHRAQLQRRSSGDGHGDRGSGYRRPLPTVGLSLIARDHMDPHLSLAALPGLQQLDP